MTTQTSTTPQVAYDTPTIRDHGSIADHTFHGRRKKRRRRKHHPGTSNF
ncbi:MAG: hypothetical protein AB7V62_04020 [Thermoleophilia bacterium]